jgi:hypothetical protein
MAYLTMDQGDTRRVVADFTGSAAPFDDLGGAAVTLYWRPIGLAGTPAGSVAGSVDAVGSDGMAHTCRSHPLDDLVAGTYRVTMKVEIGGEVEMVSRELRVSATAAP